MTVTARDDLAKAAVAWMLDSRTDYQFADDLLAAGWRPPARTIGSVEELDAMPEGSLIRCVLHHNQNFGEVWEKTWRKQWLKLDPGDRDDGESAYDAQIVLAHKYASVTVLWESGDPR